MLLKVVLLLTPTVAMFNDFLMPTITSKVAPELSQIDILNAHYYTSLPIFFVIVAWLLSLFYNAGISHRDDGISVY